MKKEYWLPSVVFLAASIPTVLALQYFSVGGDYVLLLAMGAGALATSLVLPRLRKPTEGDFVKPTPSNEAAPKKNK